MSSSLTLHRHFLWLILLAYYSVSYSKESFSKKKIRKRNTTQPRPIPQSRAQTLCVGHKLKKSLLGPPWAGAALLLPNRAEMKQHPAKGAAQPSPSLQTVWGTKIPLITPQRKDWKSQYHAYTRPLTILFPLTSQSFGKTWHWLSPNAAQLRSRGLPAVDASCSRITEHLARWLTALISSLIWLMWF